MYLVTENTSGSALEQASANTSHGPTDALALDWLEGHMRIMGFWMERLVSENGDEALIDTLHRQSQWLQQMTARLGANL